MNCFHFVRMITASTWFIFFLPDLFLWFELLLKSLCSSAGDKSVIFQLGYNLLKILEIFSVKQEANTFETSLYIAFPSAGPFSRHSNWQCSFWINVSRKYSILRFEWSNRLYEQGAVSLLLYGVGGGGGGGGVWARKPQKIWKLPLKMLFSAFWRLNLRTKEHVFHTRQ